MTKKKQASVTPKDDVLKNKAEKKPNEDIKFPIVGIGASAGGLAAIEEFFSGIPTDIDPGMAFVIVQHLAPDHKSLLTDLIQRYTRMKVFEVQDGVAVAPGCAYIIPPNRDMAFLNRKLQLLEPAAPRGQRLPIDFFFRSLAQDLGEHAIGIILSGTGSDGTLGVRAIKGAGGMVMAQNPDSTEYNGMPQSAIATGLVDYVLRPGQMPTQIFTYVNYALKNPPRRVSDASPLAESALNKIFILLRVQTSHDFSQYKPSTILRRIDRRMAVHQIETMEEYVKYLQKTPAEIEALFSDLLIGVTNFFRDPEAFNKLQEKVIPKLFSAKPSGGVIRIWSPGCSTGEEAYSLAILIAEHQQTLKLNFKVQIFATDIDSLSIRTARVGLYPASIIDDITQERLRRYFLAEPGKNEYRIHKSIRDMLIFSEQNVVKDPPFSKLDLISCRNLMIYMNSGLQKKLIPLFHYALNPKGFLFLGTSETVGEHGDLFSVIDRKFKLYQRKDDSYGSQRTTWGRFLPPISTMNEIVQPAVEKKTGFVKLPFREITEQALLKQFAPVGALVDNHGDIFYLHGRTGVYLEPVPGLPGVSNILAMAREGLKQELTMALKKAETGKEIVVTNIRVKTNGDYTLVNLIVSPVPKSPATTFSTPLFLVTFEEAQSVGSEQPPEKAILKDAAGSEASDKETDIQIEKLKQELSNKEEYLQSTNEELTTANEELKSSNEEMQSVNEELQSTNEELETSKEELQSVNEELSTVNAELQTKVMDLQRTNNDMNNLMAGTNIATLFLDHQLHVMRFTPAATRIINLIPGDVGRPVTHLMPNLAGYQNLVTDIQEVLDTLIPKEMNVQTLAGGWYTMRIQPYRTLDNVIEGAVITFIDISQIKLAETQLQRSEAFLRAIQKLTRVGGWEWNLEKKTMFWTREMYLIHDLDPNGQIPISGPDTIGFDLDRYPPEDQAVLRNAFKNCVEQGYPFDLEVDFTTAKENSLRVRIVAESEMKNGKAIRVIGFIMDITGHKSQGSGKIRTKEEPV